MTLVVASFADNGAIVMCGDSLITGADDKKGRVKLLNSFRKIKNVPINILQPYLDRAGRVKSYYDIPIPHSCMIAYAGSTLASQHMINNIEGHFKRVTFTCEGGVYKLIMECQGNKNALSTYWADDMFHQSHHEIAQFLDKEFQINLIKHAIERAIDQFISADEAYSKEFFNAEFIIALSCYKTKKNHLFEIKMDFEIDGKPNLIVKEIPMGEMASIGVTRYYEDIRKLLLDSSLELNVEERLSKGVCDAIDDNENISLMEIGYPVALKRFDSFREQRELQKRYTVNPY